MKKHRRITGLFACLLAAAVISVGMMVPKILIEGQKENSFGNTRVIKMQVNDPMSFLEGAPIVDISQSELINRLSSWSGTYTVREPNQNELSMDAAFSIARKEMQKLMDMGVIPNGNVKQYQLNNATLMAYSASDVAIWDMKFVYNDEEMGSLNIDAETGKIYWLDFSGPQSDSISNQDRAVLFAQYHAIDTDEQDYEYFDIEEWDFLKIGSLMIQVESSNSSENGFNMAIGISIAD